MLKKFFLSSIVFFYITSCTISSYCDNYFDNLSLFWKTNNSNIIFFSRNYSKVNRILVPTRNYINYNYNNSGLSILFSRKAFDNSRYMIMNIYNKNGGDEVLETIHIKTNCNKHDEIVNIDYLLTSNRDTIPEEELETNKYYSIFKDDTKIEKYDISRLYLINLCSTYLSNDDIKLCSSETQFSFLTGKMLDQNNNYINIIFKSVTSSSFKIYEFKNKEEVGNILLEGYLSPLQKGNDNWYIDLNVSKDYYFDNKYTSFSLIADISTTKDIENCDANINFYFPEDID